MSASGVKVNLDCCSAFKELQKDKKFRFIVYRLSDDEKEVVVDRKGTLEETFEDFRNYLVDVADDKVMGPPDCRFAVYDIPDEVDSSKNKGGKIMFVLWSDDKCPIKRKMLYTTTVNTLKKSLNGWHKDVECHSTDELDFDEFKKKLFGDTKRMEQQQQKH